MCVALSGLSAAAWIVWVCYALRGANHVDAQLQGIALVNVSVEHPLGCSSRKQRVLALSRSALQYTTLSGTVTDTVTGRHCQAAQVSCRQCFTHAGVRTCVQRSRAGACLTMPVLLCRPSWVADAPVSLCGFLQLCLCCVCCACVW
jgi:hypothetical protein